MKKQNSARNTVKKLKRTKRYNGVYDPEYDPSVETVLANEMTGAVPSAPKSQFEKEALEDIFGGAEN